MSYGLGNIGGIVSDYISKDDLMAFGAIGVGGIVGLVGFNYAFEKVYEVAKVDPAGFFGKNKTVIKGVGAVLTGIVAANFLGRKARGSYTKNMATGLGAGLAMAGIVTLAAKFAPAAYTSKLPTMLAGASSLYGRMLANAPVQVEEVNGAPMTIENVGGFRGGVERVLY